MEQLCSRIPRNGQRMSHISNKTNKSIKWKWDLKTTKLPDITSVIERWYSKFEIVINNSTFQNSCSENLLFSCFIFDESLDLLGGAFKCSKLGSIWTARIKVSKFRKQIFLFSFEPKNERNYFLISALASKKSSNQKTLLYNYVK